MDEDTAAGPLAAAGEVDPSSLPGFIGPQVGWWHEQGDPGYSRNELLRLLPADPYLDTQPVADLDTASLLVQELDRYQADLNLAEAARMGGLVSAYRAVLR